MRPSVSLCMIVKDEEENLAQCLDSVARHVDELVIVDTGSVDRTREVATRYGASIYEFSHRNHPEAFFVDDEPTCQMFGAPGPYSGEIAFGDFGAARNESFLHATGDFILWVDADDVVEGAENIRDVAADMLSRSLDFGFLRYDYARDHLGRVFYSQWRERIIKRGSARWVNPVHEVLMPARAIPTVRFDKVVISHRRKADRKSIANRNYKLLLRHLMQVKSANPDAPIDPRTLFYLGQEARFIEPRKAVAFYDEYLKSSGWPDERAAAHVGIGSLLEFGMLGMPPEDAYQQANREYAVAAAEVPNNPDGVLGLARIAYLRGRYQDCVNYTERGLQIGNTDSMLGMNPMDRLYRPHVYYNHALAKLNRLPEAIASCKAALAVCPDDPGVPGGASGMLTLNLKVYEEEMNKHLSQQQLGKEPMLVLDKNEDVDAPPVTNIPHDAQAIWAMQLWKQIIANGDLSRARTFLASLPVNIAADPVVARMIASTERRTGDVRIVVPVSTSTRPNVVLYLGPGVEPWNPSTPNTQGLGGSETAAIEMAKNLVALGHAVTIYAEAEGKFDGVMYAHHSKFKGANCDVFVSSRAPWAVAEFGPVLAKLKLLWVHDIHCGPAAPKMEWWLYQFDRVFCLSNWHKDFVCSTYPTLHPGQVVVTRNGIDVGRFSQMVPKENRMVFSSSPNRGLPALLHNLPYIRRKVTDAHLDVFYGFETWETMAKARNSQPESEEISRYKALIAEAVNTGAVTWHGRKSQRELAAAFMRAKVWGYPTEFPETSCITAMEAQAAGCVPVTTRFAALAETVKHGILLDSNQEYGQQFVDHCVRLMTDEAYHRSFAEPGRAHALANLSWASLAKEWSKMFDKLIAEIAMNPVPMWRNA